MIDVYQLAWNNLATKMKNTRSPSFRKAAIISIMKDTLLEAYDEMRSHMLEQIGSDSSD